MTNFPIDNLVDLLARVLLLGRHRILSFAHFNGAGWNCSLSCLKVHPSGGLCGFQRILA